MIVDLFSMSSIHTFNVKVNCFLSKLVKDHKVKEIFKEGQLEISASTIQYKSLNGL